MDRARQADALRGFAFLVRDVARLNARNFFERHASGLGLTLAQCRLLCYVQRFEGASQARLAEWSDTDPMTLGRALLRMESPLRGVGETRTAFDRIRSSVGAARTTEVDDIDIESCTTVGSVVVPAALAVAATAAGGEQRVGDGGPLFARLVLLAGGNRDRVNAFIPSAIRELARECVGNRRAVVRRYMLVGDNGDVMGRCALTNECADPTQRTRLDEDRVAE